MADIRAPSDSAAAGSAHRKSAGSAALVAAWCCCTSRRIRPATSFGLPHCVGHESPNLSCASWKRCSLSAHRWPT